jgi:hypothetical protein
MDGAIGVTKGRSRGVGLATAFLVAAAMLLPLQTTDVRAQNATAEAPQVPDPYKLNMLIRTTLIALNQANRTGNYTVLRDLAAPAFQRTNNAARLAEIFAKLRKRDLDLSPILFFQPKLQGPANLTDNGLLRLTGYFETKPERISFDMLFQPVASDWRLFGLAVDVAPPKAAEQTPSASTTQQPGEGAEVVTQPAASQDSAPVTPAAQQAPRPEESAFAPQVVSLPLPDQRPTQPIEDDPERSARQTSSGAEEASSSDAGWTLWGN